MLLVEKLELSYLLCTHKRKHTKNFNKLMSPYAIFVILLTIAYIIYYGYIISKDVYGKKGPETASEEEFEIDAFENAIQVRETEHGFSIGSQEESLSEAQQSDVSAEEDQNGIGEKFAEIESQMEEAEMESTGGVDYIQLGGMLRDAYENGGKIANGIKIVMDHV